MHGPGSTFSSNVAPLRRVAARVGAYGPALAKSSSCVATHVFPLVLIRMSQAGHAPAWPASRSAMDPIQSGAGDARGESGATTGAVAGAPSRGPSRS